MDSGETKRQVARAARPDAVDGRGDWFLLKAVSHLRLTYQIKTLTFGAASSRVILHIRVPRNCSIARPLHDFLKQNKKHISLERIN